jgi:ribosomal protein L11 methyltransferase
MSQYTLTVSNLLLAEAERMAAGFDDEGADAPLSVSLNETDEALDLWELVALYDSEPAALKAQWDREGFVCTVASLVERDWVRESLLGLAPVTAGRFFLYGSHDRDRRRAGGVSLEIDAGTAFGTGHHGTTAGCLLALDVILKRSTPRQTLDLGCGTGVLGLAASVMLKKRVWASDIDPEAVRVSLCNAAINGARNGLRTILAPGLRHPLLRKAAPFDLLFANILARPLVALAGGISAALAPGGHLVLSGLTHGQERMVGAAYRNRGLLPVWKLRLGSWSVLVYRRTAERPGRKAPGVRQMLR